MNTQRYNATYVYWLCCIATLGGILFGFSTGVIAGAQEFIQLYFDLDSTETGWLVSSIFFGCILGAGIAGKLADKLGRKKTLFLSMLAFFISTIGSTFADSFTVFSLARVVSGIGIGLASTVAPMYMGEIAPKEIRGKSSGIWNVSLVGSQMLIFLINFIIAKGMAETWLVELGWRWMMGAQFIPVALMFVGTLLLPETPEWCIKAGRAKEAVDVLSKIYPDLNKEEAQQIFEARKSDSDSTSKGANNLRFIFRTPVLRYGMIVGCTVAMLQQVTGASVVLYYAPVILQTGDITQETILFQTIFLGLLNAIGAFIGMNLFDHFGRKPIMKIGTVGSIISLLMISYSMYTHHTGYFSIMSALIFIVMFAISWGSGCWVLISEIFPARIKEYGMGFAVMLMWMVNFVVAQLFPMINDIPILQETFNGAFTMWIFAALNGFCLFFLSRYVPETKGVALEDIEDLLQQHMQSLSNQQPTQSTATTK